MTAPNRMLARERPQHLRCMSRELQSSTFSTNPFYWEERIHWNLRRFIEEGQIIGSPCEVSEHLPIENVR